MAGTIKEDIIREATVAIRAMVEATTRAATTAHTHKEVGTTPMEVKNQVVRDALRHAVLPALPLLAAAVYATCSTERAQLM